MLIRTKELVNIADEKVYNVDIKQIEMKGNPYLRRVEDVKGTIIYYYDINDKLVIDYDLEGKMVCPDCYTLEDVYLDFHLSEAEDVTFKEDEDGFYMYGDMDDSQIVLSLVIPEAPIKVEKSNKTSYYRGDDWQIMSEEEYDNDQKNKIDPRMAKILDYKEED